MVDTNNIGVICDLDAANITGTAQAFEFQGGNAGRVVFYAHAEFGAGSPITRFDLKLQGSYDDTNWADVALRKAVDDTTANPQQLAAGPTLEVAYYAENLRGARYARLVVTGQGGAGVAGDKLLVRAVIW